MSFDVAVWRRHLLSVAVLGVALALPAGASAMASPRETPATGSPAIPDRVFDQDSFWYRPLPDDAPVASDSDAIIADLVRQGEEHYGSPGAPAVTINTDEFAPPIYVAGADDPVVAVGFDNCQGKPADDVYVQEMFTGPQAPLRAVRIPAEAQPAGGSDGEIAIYDEVDDRVVELWQMQRHANGDVSACWGGVIEDAAQSDGVFPHPFGTTASGLSLLGGTITGEELASGRIEHVVGIAMPFTAEAPTLSAPANRTDGVNPHGWSVPRQGQMLRLPADLDLDALALSPTARALAQAAQDYGLIVWDTAYALSFRAQGPASIANDEFYDIVFQGRAAWEEFSGGTTADGAEQDPFPLEELQALPPDYSSPLPGTPGAPAADAAADDEGDDGNAEAGPNVPSGLLLAGGLGVLAVAAIALALLPRRSKR